jgi:HPt (histidine-containing phosphotransfer) domain-containing protein
MAGCNRPQTRGAASVLTDATNSTEDAPEIVDWVHFEKCRAELGPGFIRILNYFREDGAKSVSQIEQAMHNENTAALVIPAHTIKGEARQFGAEPLAEVAELIETTARLCIETQRFPDELIRDVVELKRLFQETVTQFDKATNPLRTRAPQGAFGRKAGGQSFDRL